MGAAQAMPPSNEEGAKEKEARTARPRASVRAAKLAPPQMRDSTISGRSRSAATWMAVNPFFCRKVNRGNIRDGTVVYATYGSRSDSDTTRQSDAGSAGDARGHNNQSTINHPSRRASIRASGSAPASSSASAHSLCPADTACKSGVHPCAWVSGFAPADRRSERMDTWPVSAAWCRSDQPSCACPRIGRGGVRESPQAASAETQLETDATPSTREQGTATGTLRSGIDTPEADRKKESPEWQIQRVWFQEQPHRQLRIELGTSSEERDDGARVASEHRGVEGADAVLRGRVPVRTAKG